MKNLLLFMAIFSTFVAAAQQNLNTSAETTSLEVIEQNNFDFRVQCQVSELKTQQISTKMGAFIHLGFNGSLNESNVGYPELPVFSKLIEIPYGSQVDVRIISYQEEVIDLNKKGISNRIIPNQPPLAKNQDPHNVKFRYNQEAYNTNGFLRSEAVRVLKLGTMRGKQLGKIIINPFEYHPVKNLLKVKYDMVVEVTFKNADLTTTKQLAQKYHSPIFEGQFGQLLNNNPSTKDQIVSYPVKYVIVAPSMFQSTLQDFVAWKTKKGFNVVEAYTNNPLVGSTTTSIKSYLQGLYSSATATDPAPSYVLIVGDVAQIPAHSGTVATHVTDLYYCEYDGGGDYLPDAYYGRFSATNIEELESQIDKTLEYEQYLMPNPSFLDTVVMVSGVDGTYATTHGNGQINYGTSTYFNAAHGIYSNTYLYPASGSSATQIRNNISAGCSFANYTAHGSSSGWADPSFTVSHVSSMTNNGKYPLMIGNACVTNKFDVSVCFGEALLRAENKGAIGYIGASNNTYWNADYYWGVGAVSVSTNPSYSNTALGAYDCTFHDHGEAEADWFVTQGQMIHAGNLAVTQAESATTITRYWEIYHLMGDPSLMVYYSVPSAMVANYNQSLQIGSSSLQVSTEPNAYVALSENGTLLDAKYTGSTGTVTLNFSALSTVGNADLVITKQNRQPYFGTVQILPGNTPFIELQSFNIIDPQGNGNGIADYGESLSLGITLSNIGSQAGGNVMFAASTTDPYITLTNATAAFGTIGGSASASNSTSVLLTIAANAPDQHPATINYSITADGGNSWSGSFDIQIAAPQLSMGSYYINDLATGNGNGILDAGETGTLQIEASNTGTSACFGTSGILSSNSNLLVISNPTATIGTLIPGATHTNNFIIQADASLATGTEIVFTYLLQAGLYQASTNFSEHIGIVQGNYCIPSSNCSAGDQIDDFSFNTINQIGTGCGTDGYSDFSTISTTVERGETYTMSFTTNYANQYTTVWVDLNNDGTFANDSTERWLLDFNISTTTSTHSTDITIPTWASLGSHRMRVRCHWSDPCDDPCITYNYGETHDYTLSIINSTTLPPEVSLCSDFSLCEGDSYTVNPIVSGGQLPYSYLWNNGETTSSLTVSPIQNTLYEVTVTDANQNTGTDEVLISINPLPIVNLGPDLNISLGTNIILDAGAGFINYLWSTGDVNQTILADTTGLFSITVMDNNSCFNSDEILVTLSSGPGWNAPITSTNHTVLVPNNISITIDGVQVENGDYLGVFYDSLGTLACSGYMIWDGNTGSLTAWGEDVGNDGFVANEPFKWKIWDASEEMEYDATATYMPQPIMPNGGSFTVNGMSGLQSLNAIIISTQNIVLAQGWSIISSHISPDDLAISTIFTPVVNDVVIIKNGNGDIYWPQFAVNSIVSFDPTQGYHIKMATQKILGLNGLALDPNTTSLSIPQGWSLISYLPSAPANIETVFASIQTNLQMVKDGQGNAYWPAWGVNLIGTMHPGKGYLIHVDSAQIFTYPTSN